MNNHFEPKHAVFTECIKGFEPVIPPSPKVLLLGTMPSVASLQQDFYYAHPRNAFWPIMAALFNQSTPLVHQADKVAVLQHAGILLWDVLAACQRHGSLDSAIQQPVANDFSALFTRFLTLKTVVFNGQKAQQLFYKHALKQQNLPNDLVFITLPSSSPAHASLTLDDKRLLWQEKLAFLG
ncbi:DNA-deoxyinosine glycosylase [Thiomicrorhabdus aquaedulcis]|uniref:DNA-deoxyinosine glycosylase n=1 Tax=Thiomicrorhabdus aquaedulcis TaxID=2211106 RepID=UPI000FD8F2C7|nr:DNA-deoxyinosine glycosylase [Thiomicrorhabdus aquaedulcis]